jgi:hypothetical protein
MRRFLVFFFPFVLLKCNITIAQDYYPHRIYAQVKEDILVSQKDTVIEIYPNPTHNTLTVESTSPVREITVYDQTGRTVAVETRCTTSLQQIVNTASLHNGIYILKVVTDNGTETAKFVKK